MSDKLVNRLETGVERLTRSVINNDNKRDNEDIESKEILRETPHIIYSAAKNTIRITNATAHLTGAVLINNGRKIVNKIQENKSNNKADNKSNIKHNNKINSKSNNKEINISTNFHMKADYAFVKGLDKIKVDNVKISPNNSLEVRLIDKNSSIHTNYTGLKRAYFKIDDVINGRTETVVKLQQSRFLKGRGKIVVETRKPFGRNKVTLQKIGSWNNKKKMLSQKQYDKMMSKFSPDLLQEGVLKGKHNFKQAVLKDAPKKIKNAAFSPLRVTGHSIKQHILQDEGTGSKLIAKSMIATSRYKQMKSVVNFTKRVTVGTAKTTARVAWNTPKATIKTVKAVAHPVRTTKAVGNVFVKIFNNLKKEITKTLTTAVLPYAAGFVFLCICIILISNTLGTALSVVGQASYSADANSFKILTETISKLDANYQKQLDLGDFKELAKHIEKIEVCEGLDDNNYIKNNLLTDKSDILFSEGSKIRIKIDNSKVYSSEQAWDGTIKKENWKHLTDSKIHSDRVAFFDYVNAKYQDSMKNENNYTDDVNNFLEEELGDEDSEIKEEIKEENNEVEKIEIKEYSSDHVKKDVSDMWGVLQYLDLEVTNEDDLEKPIFKNLNETSPYLFFVGSEGENGNVNPSNFSNREVDTKTLHKEYPDPEDDGDIRIVECNRNYSVTNVNMRFTITRPTGENVIFSNVICDGLNDCKSFDANHSYYVTELWRLNYGEEHEWSECTSTCNHHENFEVGHRILDSKYATYDEDKEFYYINDFEGNYGFVRVNKFNDYVDNGIIKPYTYTVDETKEYYRYDENPDKSFIGNQDKIYRKIKLNNEYNFNCCEGNKHRWDCPNLGEGYIFGQDINKRKEALNNNGLAGYYAFIYEMPVPKFGGSIKEWTGYYEQIYKCNETHTSTTLRWRLNDDENLKEAMTLDDRSDAENESAIELYNAFLDFESNGSSAIVGNIFNNTIVAIKRENGYRYDETKNDIVKKELEVYSENGWKIFAPMSGNVTVEKPFDNDEKYLIIEGDIEWDMGYDKSLWKSIKDGIVKFFTNKEPAPCPYRVPRFYISLNDVKLDSVLQTVVDNEGSSRFVINGNELGTCIGESLHFIPTYLVWDGKKFEMQDYDLNCYMENIATSIGAINESELPRDSVGYVMLELAEKYKEYNYYYVEATNYQIKQLKNMSTTFLKNTKYYDKLQQIVNGDGEISFSNIGFIRKVLSEMQTEGYDVSINIDGLIIPNDMKTLSKSITSNEIIAGDFILLTPKSESDVKYVGIIADPDKHTMLIQEDEFSQYVHYANWNDSQWSGYEKSYGRIDIKLGIKTETTNLEGKVE